MKTKVALEAIREELTLADLSHKYGIRATQAYTWKPATIAHAATAFARRGAGPEQVSAAEDDDLHFKIVEAECGCPFDARNTFDDLNM